MNFRVIEQEVLHWYTANKRDLPWRKTQNPYHVWLSEVIMQQTRIAQGTAYYHRFVDTFPTIVDLASAEIDLVLKLWEGLGYYSRARNLHIAANQIVELHIGHFPNNYAALIQIKGIGPYTAAAIASICFHQKTPVIDGNVYRVLSRLFGIFTPINSHAAKSEFTAIAQQIIDNSIFPGDLNQGMMELGAMVCTPKNARCEACPLQVHCVAFKNNLVHELPIKIKKKPVRHRFFNFFINQNKSEIAIEKRGAGDIWQGLYQFPMIETTENYSHADELAGHTNKKFVVVKKLDSCRHLLTHQTLHITFWQIKTQVSTDEMDCNFVAMPDLINYAFPVPLKNFIESKLLHLPPE
jgi:A/G-specific adenine glycosylase